MILTFDAEQVRRLLELSAASKARWPTLSQMQDPELLRDDLDEAHRETVAAEIARDGWSASVRLADIDPAKAPPGLVLVGDQGVYLMSNAPRGEVEAAGVDPVAYAAECHPERCGFDDWWRVKRESFGPDDGAEALSADFVEAALREARDGRLRLEVTPESIGAPCAEEAPSPCR